MAAIPVDPREELERLERKHAENPEGRYFVPLADAYRRSGDLTGAIDLLRAGLHRHPDYLSAHVVLGRCYADSGDPVAAEAEFRYILSLDPQNLIALRTLGDIALVDGRVREAERWYQDLLAVDPMNDDARSALRQLRESSPSGAGEPDGATFHGGAEARIGGRVDGELAGQEGYAFDEGRGEMLSRSPGDDRSPFFDDEDAVVTETIAELYTRQGFFDRAAEIYRELIRRRGSDASLEAKLRRVEALASGSETETNEPSSSAEPRADIRTEFQTYGTVETPPTESEPAAPDDQGVEPPEPEDEIVVGAADSLYPLIGPAGEFPESDEAPDESGEFEPQLPPAYDFAAAEGEELLPDGDSDDLQDLLIDPFADPFGSVSSTMPTELSARSFGSMGGSHESIDDVSGSGGTGSDPFADSFSEGFPLLGDDAGVPEDVAVAAAEAGTDTGESERGQSSSGVAISAFLRSVATWSRSGRGKEAGTGPELLEADTGSESTSEAHQEEEPFPATSPAFEEPPSAERPTSTWESADMGFDAALGHSAAEPEPAAAEPSEAIPAESSGADDLQLVSGVDDLFPWEIPVPEPGSQALPPVQPLDLDPGYPFEEASSSEATSVDESVHSERFPSAAVEPSASSDTSEPSSPTAAEPEAGDMPPAAEITPEGSDQPAQADDDATGTTSSLPAEVQDDDDLESFQAWLRSLKR